MADDGRADPPPIPHKWAYRIAVAIIGGTICLVGMAMIVLPGPAMVVLPLGLGILGLQFAWARRWLARLKQTADGIADGVVNHTPWHRSKSPPATTPGGNDGHDGRAS